MSTILWKVNGGSTRKGHVAVARVNGLTRLDDGYQSCRASGIHIDGRTAQVQLVSDPRRDVVLFIVDAELKFTDSIDKFRIRQQVFLVVGRCVRTRPDTNFCLGRFGMNARVLEGVVGHFEANALLRVDQFGFVRCHTEKMLVKQIRIVDDSSCGHVLRAVDCLGGQR